MQMTASLALRLTAYAIINTKQVPDGQTYIRLLLRGRAPTIHTWLLRALNLSRRSPTLDLNR